MIWYSNELNYCGKIIVALIISYNTTLENANSHSLRTDVLNASMEINQIPYTLTYQPSNIHLFHLYFYLCKLVHEHIMLWMQQVWWPVDLSAISLWILRTFMVITCWLFHLVWSFREFRNGWISFFSRMKWILLCITNKTELLLRH